MDREKKTLRDLERAASRSLDHLSPELSVDDYAKMFLAMWRVMKAREENDAAQVALAASRDECG